MIPLVGIFFLPHKVEFCKKEPAKTLNCDKIRINVKNLGRFECMKIISVFDEAFSAYGRVLKGYDTAPIVDALNKNAPLPDGVTYSPSEPVLEACSIFGAIQNNTFGGVPIELGWCTGHNVMLNCLEYHKSSEVCVGTEDFILLLALMTDIKDGMLDTQNVKAFLAPKNTVIETYGTSLHYAPCSAKKGQGFKVAVALPKGTNVERGDGGKPIIPILDAEDELLWRPNKWLLAHADSGEAAAGAKVRLTGENIDITQWI